MNQARKIALLRNRTVISAESFVSARPDILSHSGFSKEENMADCGCGRSPTGQCIGWHKLSEEEYQEKLKQLEENMKEQDDD
jgi:hypothetical protein